MNRNKSPRFRARWAWHCRKAGGLFLGVRFHFPVSVVRDPDYEDDPDEHTVWTVQIGLLVATVTLDYWHKQEGA